MDATAFRPAASFLALAGVLHLMSPIFAGLSGVGWGMLAIGLVYIAASFLLRQGRRWLGYIVFIVMLIGALAAYMQTGPAAALPNWLSFAIVAANIGCVLCLFSALWHSPPERT